MWKLHTNVICYEGGESQSAHLFLKQWDAVIIHRWLMMDPPQICLDILCMLTCQGHAPFNAEWPPAIRNGFDGPCKVRSPQP